MTSTAQRDYVPELYDATTPASIGGDVEWYVDLAARAGGRVLELGAGTGRITLPIAAAGVHVHALDADDEMLARARFKLDDAAPDLRERVQFVHADLRDFDVPQRFALVIAPFRVILHTGGRAGLLRCLRSVHRHLEDGGTFAFDVFHPSLAYMAANAGALAGVWRASGVHAWTGGRRIHCSESTHYDTVRQQFVALRRYEVVEADGRVESQYLQELRLAYFYAGDLQRALAECGFRDVVIRGGFGGREFERDDDDLVVVARR